MEQTTKSETVPRVTSRPNLGRVIGYGGAVLFFLAAFNVLWTACSISQAYELLTNQHGGSTESFARELADNKVTELSRSCASKEDPAESSCLAKDATMAIKACASGVPEPCLSDQEMLTGKADEARVRARAARDEKLRVYYAGQYLALGPSCIKHLTDWAKTDKEALEGKKPGELHSADGEDKRCQALLGAAIGYASRNLVIEQNSSIGKYVQYAAWWLFSWQVPVNGAQTVSLDTPTALMMIGVVLVLVGLGLGTTGAPFGALMSPNGRYSLALAQVSFWTVLVLTSVAAIAIFNGGLVSEMVRHVPLVDKVTAASPTAVTKGFFPAIPEGIWGVLAISFGSTLLSIVIKAIKGTGDESAEPADKQKQAGVRFFDAPVAGFDPTHKASVADWFLGEDEGNKNKIDISRVQMVLITAGLLVTYGNALFADVRDLTLQEILLAIQNVDVLIATLPPVGATMAAMLAISHATYLVSKAADTPTSAQTASTSKDGRG